MKLQWKRYRGWLITAAVVVLVIVWALWPRPVPVDFGAVSRGPLEVTLDEEGETRVKERFVVSAPLAGRVLRIELEPGESVTAGTVLATLEPATPTLLDARSRAEARAEEGAGRAEVESARTQLESSRAELEFARAELRRIEQLAEDGIVSTTDLETAQLEVKRRQEALRAAEAAVETARNRLAVVRARLANVEGAPRSPGDVVEVRSPVEGVVLRRLRESEAVVVAGEALLEVGNPAEIEIVADYLSSDAVRIDVGDPARIERWGGEEALAAVVRRVEPSGFLKVSALGVEEQRVNVILDLVTPPAQRPGLADGFRVDVAVIVWQGEDVLQVPLGSLLRQGDGWAVFVVEGETARLRSVKLGHRGALSVEVLEGVEAGETVILYPGDGVVDGVQVAERKV